MVEVHVNFAMTQDGSLGRPGPSRLRVSGAEDKARVHRLRAACDAILVGVGTVLADDPKLTVRRDLAGQGATDPLRVVLDSKGRTPPRARVLGGGVGTVVYTGTGASHVRGSVEVATGPEGVALAEVLEDLGRRGVKRLMVEGGAHVLASFFRDRLVDVATVFVSPDFVEAPDAVRVPLRVFDADLEVRSVEPLDDGVLVSLERGG